MERAEYMAALTVFNIQRMAMHDGPGIRTTVFLKGCNLACAWCHNPESQDPAPEVLWEQNRCIGCGKCVGICAAHQHTVGLPARELCTRCGLCARDCPAGALKLAGERREVAGLLAEVLRDRQLFSISGGGVTFSGGEPMLQREVLLEALEGLRQQKIHTAVDTAGNVPWEWFQPLLSSTELFLYDLKLIDPQLHMRYTKADNRLILDNLKKLSAVARVFVRIPLIAGVNLEQIEPMADFLKECPGVERVELLQYHELGRKKYQELGRPMVQFQPPTAPQLEHCVRTLASRGLQVSL